MEVLLVEDEQHTLIEIKHFINTYQPKWNVHAFALPKLAINCLNNQPFDIAFLDVSMPDINGFELAENVLSKNNDCKIVFITGHNNYAAEAFEVNAFDYLLKPINPERIEQTFKKLEASITSVISIESLKLDITLFNEFKLFKNLRPIKWQRRKSPEIFCYLLLNHNVSVHKDRIVDEVLTQLDYDSALKTLQTCIYQIKKSLDWLPAEQFMIEYNNNSYRLELHDATIDIFEFNRIVEKLKNQQASTAELELARDLYGNGLLTFDGWMWILSRQAEYEEKYIRILKTLINIYILQRNTKALERDLFALRSYLDPFSLEYNQYQEIVFSYFSEDVYHTWLKQD